MNLSSMCRQPGKCPASASARRMGMEDNHPARSEELSRSTGVHGFNAEPRKLSTSTCPWVAAGSVAQLPQHAAGSVREC
ncbi:unnamed protein product [Cladocopium goreaui]|uniref:Uncharacterized protein n=1 Tax=Cladocopium goreaui TaxID=2562237 RepID=A0A9P1C4D8_9DINO|nr:unnamed protein product [Cladocopium goreaui]